MSMNFGLEATREIQVVKTGEFTTQTQEVDLWQTPTSVTSAILEAKDPVQAYCEWVLAQSKDIPYLIYEEDDIWGDGTPIGQSSYNPGKDHVDSVQAWVSEMIAQGYEVRGIMF